MRTCLSALALFVLAIVSAPAATIAPGLYGAAGKVLYIGIEHELPDPAENESFDETTGRIGHVASATNLQIRCRVSEIRRVIEAREGRLGASLYYRTAMRRATVVLIHGADAEGREMGFIIPYFVCNGVNVVSYDQRGVGESTGNWFLTSPAQRPRTSSPFTTPFAKIATWTRTESASGALATAAG